MYLPRNIFHIYIARHLPDPFRGVAENRSLATYINRVYPRPYVSPYHFIRVGFLVSVLLKTVALYDDKSAGRKRNATYRFHFSAAAK